MGVKYKKVFNIGKNIKVKISANGNITIITRYKDDDISLNKNRLIVYGKNGVIKRQKQLWIFKKKKLNFKYIIKGFIEKKIKKRNKKIIINDLINSDNDLKRGIKKYKFSRIFFWCFLSFAFAFNKSLILMISFILISIYFSIQAFYNIKYKKAYLIANSIGKDLAFMTTYNEEKVNELLNGFKKHYTSETKEYIQLKNAINNFNKYGIKLAKNFSNIEIEDVSYYLKNINLRKEEIKNNKYLKNNTQTTKKSNNKKNDKNRIINYISSFDNNVSNKWAVLSRRGIQNNANVKSINRAIEFFDDGESLNEMNKEKAVVSKAANNLTIYFYKKSSVL